MSLNIWEQYYVSMGEWKELAGVMKGRTVSMDVKKGLRNSILLPTQTYGLENWTWNEAQQSRVHAVEMSYLGIACGVSKWDGFQIRE